jgi:hypothetical protein
MRCGTFQLLYTMTTAQMYQQLQFYVVSDMLARRIFLAQTLQMNRLVLGSANFECRIGKHAGLQFVSHHYKEHCGTNVSRTHMSGRLHQPVGEPLAVLMPLADLFKVRFAGHNAARLPCDVDTSKLMMRARLYSTL